MASKFKYHFGLFPPLCGVLIASLFLYLNVTPQIATKPSLQAARESGMRENELGWPQTHCVTILAWSGAGLDAEFMSYLNKTYGHSDTVWNFTALAVNIVVAAVSIAAVIYPVEFLMRRRSRA